MIIVVLNKLKHPPQSSLLVLATRQWLLLEMLIQQEGKRTPADHKCIWCTLKQCFFGLSCIQAQLWMQLMTAAIIRGSEEGTLPTKILKVCWEG